MADGGTVFGYFVALLVLICGVPVITICIRYARRRLYDSNDLIEVKLAESAKQFIAEEREHVVLNYVEVSRDSITSKAMRQLSSQKLEEKPVSKLTEAYYRYALQNSNVYWGIKDILYPGGKIGCFQFPSGLVEDAVFYACNDINPLAFVFADDSHPESITSRFLVFCTAQSFTLMIYVLFPSGIIKTIISYIFAPIIVAIEYFLTITLLCPCLRQNDDIEEEGSEVSQENKERDSVLSDDVRKKAKKGGIFFLRSVGALLAFPLIFVLVLMLVIIAIELAKHSIPHQSALLAKFLWDGILFPFILKLLKASANYWWFVSPIRLNLCCIPSMFSINSWSEVKLWEEDMLRLKDLSKEQKLSVLAQQNRTRVSPADFMHCSCHVLRYAGLKTDTHHSLDICTPSCYCGRCCDAIDAMYWENGNMFGVEQDLDERHLSRSLLLSQDGVTSSSPSNGLAMSERY